MRFASLMTATERSGRRRRSAWTCRSTSAVSSAFRAALERTTSLRTVSERWAAPRTRRVPRRPSARSEASVASRPRCRTSSAPDSATMRSRLPSCRSTFWYSIPSTPAGGGEESAPITRPTPGFSLRVCATLAARGPETPVTSTTRAMATRSLGGDGGGSGRLADRSPGEGEAATATRGTRQRRPTRIIPSPRPTPGEERECLRVRGVLEARPRPRRDVRREQSYFLLRRATRVRLSSLRCFFFAIRLRRFLMTEPMGSPSR